jgi:hypothetical protein
VHEQVHPMERRRRQSCRSCRLDNRKHVLADAKKFFSLSYPMESINKVKQEHGGSKLEPIAGTQQRPEIFETGDSSLDSTDQGEKGLISKAGNTDPPKFGEVLDKRNLAEHEFKARPFEEQFHTSSGEDEEDVDNVFEPVENTDTPTTEICISPPVPLSLPIPEDWVQFYVDNKFENKAIAPKNFDKHIARVRIIECKNLRNSDTSLRSEPFVSLRIPDMDRFERQACFSTHQSTTMTDSRNPVFNETFYLPVHDEDINMIRLYQSESGKVVQELEVTGKVGERFGIKISVFYRDGRGDHDPLGSCFLFYNQFSIVPNSDSARMLMKLEGYGTSENSTILIEAYLQPPLVIMRQMATAMSEERASELRKEEKKKSEECDGTGVNKVLAQKCNPKAIKRSVEGVKGIVRTGDSNLNKESEEHIVQDLLCKIHSSAGATDSGSCFDEDGPKFRSYLSLARLARATEALRSLVGRSLLGNGLSMVIADLANKTRRIRQAAATLLCSIVHNEHTTNMRILRSHSGFQIDDVHVFWIPTSLRDAYLDAGSQLKADAAQREREGRRRAKPVSWWPPSEHGFVAFLQEKLKRALHKDSSSSHVDMRCDHTYNEAFLKLVCFPAAPVLKKENSRREGMAWFLSEMLNQLKTGTLFTELREVSGQLGGHTEKDSKGLTVQMFEDALSKYGLRDGIDDLDFDRFMSMFLQEGCNDGSKYVNLVEMSRALLPEVSDNSPRKTKPGSVSLTILDRTIPFLRQLIGSTLSATSNDDEKSKHDIVYNMMALDEDGGFALSELIALLEVSVNGGNTFEKEEISCLLSFFNREDTDRLTQSEFESCLSEWQSKEEDVPIFDQNIFKRLARVDDADDDASLVDWMPDPEIHLLGFRVPSSSYLETSLGDYPGIPMVGFNDPMANAKEIADITRLRKLFDRLNTKGIVSLRTLRRDEVFVELLGREGVMALQSHFRKKFLSCIGGVESDCADKEVESVEITWEDFVGYRRYLQFRQNVARQRAEALKFQSSPVHLFSWTPELPFSQRDPVTGSVTSVKLEGLPRYRNVLIGKFASDAMDELARVPRTRVIVKVFGEPLRQTIRFDASLKSPDGSLYRARTPLSSILPATKRNSSGQYDIEEILTLEIDALMPVLGTLILPPHHIHAGDDTRLNDVVPDTVKAWAETNKLVLMEQKKKGGGASLLSKEKTPDAIALRGLQVGLELFKADRKEEVWSLLEQTVSLIIKACPSSAQRSIAVTRALDTLISQYKHSKSVAEETPLPPLGTVSENKSLYLLRDSVRQFRKEYIAATASLQSKKQEQLLRLQVLETPKLQKRRMKQLKKDNGALKRIVADNRRKIEETKSLRFEQLRRQSKEKELKRTEQTARNIFLENERKRRAFRRTQEKGRKQLEEGAMKKKQERQWQLQSRRLHAKKEKIQKKEAAALKERQDVLKKEAKHALIKRQEAFLLSKAERSNLQTQGLKENEFPIRPSKTDTHERLLKFGERIASRRIKSRNPPERDKIPVQAKERADKNEPLAVITEI